MLYDELPEHFVLRMGDMLFHFQFYAMSMLHFESIPDIDDTETTPIKLQLPDTTQFIQVGEYVQVAPKESRT